MEIMLKPNAIYNLCAKFARKCILVFADNTDIERAFADAEKVVGPESEVMLQEVEARYEALANIEYMMASPELLAAIEEVSSQILEFARKIDTIEKDNPEIDKIRYYLKLVYNLSRTTFKEVSLEIGNVAPGAQPEAPEAAGLVRKGPKDVHYEETGGKEQEQFRRQHQLEVFPGGLLPSETQMSQREQYRHKLYTTLLPKVVKQIIDSGLDPESDEAFDRADKSVNEKIDELMDKAFFTEEEQLLMQEAKKVAQQKAKAEGLSANDPKIREWAKILYKHNGGRTLDKRERQNTMRYLQRLLVGRENPIFQREKELPAEERRALVRDRVQRLRARRKKEMESR